MASYRELYSSQKKFLAVVFLGFPGVNAALLAIALLMGKPVLQFIPPVFYALYFAVNLVVGAIYFYFSRKTFLSAPDPDAEYKVEPSTITRLEIFIASLMVGAAISTPFYLYHLLH